MSRRLAHLAASACDGLARLGPALRAGAGDAAELMAIGLFFTAILLLAGVATGSL